MMMSLRKSFSETSEPSPAPKFQTLFAQASNSVSCVTPRSSVIGSYSVRPGDLRLRGRVAALAVLDDLGRPLQRAHLAHARDVAAVPLHPELEVLVWVEALCIDGELQPSTPPHAVTWPAICWIWMTTNSAGFSGAKPTRMLTMPRSMSFWVVVSRVALDEVRVARRRALERALAEQVLHERADVEPDLRPQRLVVRLEHHPLRPAVEALFDVERQSPHRDVLPFATRGCPRPRACARPRRRCPTVGNVRRQLTPSGLRSRSRRRSASPSARCTPESPASRPAGAFHTPRAASVRAITPATAPHGGKSATAPPASGSAARKYGK